MRVGKTRRGKQPKCFPPEHNEIEFPTPQFCQNLNNLPTLMRKSLDNVAELQKRDLLYPQKNKHDKNTFLAHFHWSLSTLNQDEFSELHYLLVDHVDNFAKHSLDVG